MPEVYKNSKGQTIEQTDSNGRNRVFIDWKLVENLCKIQCTQEEIASVVNVCLDTLQSRCSDEHGVSFSEFFKQKKEGGKASLRRSQWKTADSGNPTMQIWLGKQYLKQTDKNELSSDGDGININYNVIKKQ